MVLCYVSRPCYQKKMGSYQPALGRSVAPLSCAAVPWGDAPPSRRCGPEVPVMWFAHHLSGVASVVFTSISPSAG